MQWAKSWPLGLPVSRVALFFFAASSRIGCCSSGGTGALSTSALWLQNRFDFGPPRQALLQLSYVKTLFRIFAILFITGYVAFQKKLLSKR